MSETTPSVGFTPGALSLNGNKLHISLDQFNSELDPYGIKVDSIDDIKIDKELTEINRGSVVKVHSIYINPDGGFDADWFFNKGKDLEDQLEKLDFVYSAEFDRGELVLIIVLNKKEVELVKTFEKGGSMAEQQIAAQVDAEIQKNALGVFQLVGLAAPANDQEAEAKIPEARQLAIEHYKKNTPRPVYVFYQGRKLDITHEASPGSLYMQTAITAAIAGLLRGQVTGEQGEQVVSSAAAHKAIFAMTNLHSLAEKTLPEPFHVDDEMMEYLAKHVL